MNEQWFKKFFLLMSNMNLMKHRFVSSMRSIGADSARIAACPMVGDVEKVDNVT